MKNLPAVVDAVMGRGGKQNGKEIKFLCPAHEESTPSASLNIKKCTWRCFACDAHGGLKHLAGLLDVEWERESKTTPTDDIVDNFDALLLPAGIPYQLSGMTQSGIWDYRDAKGNIKGYAVRYDGRDDKKSVIPFFRYTDGKWQKGAPKAPRALYGLDILSARPESPVMVVEGEKCARALLDLGIVSVTSQGGSSASSKSNWSPLSGRDVIIWPDNDTPGTRYCHTVAAGLSAQSIKIIDVSRLDLPKGGDCVDWLKINPGATKQAIFDLPVLTDDSIANENWIASLLTNGTGAVKNSRGNALVIIQNMDGLRGVFGQNVRDRRLIVRKAPPWEDSKRFSPRWIRDTDYLFCERYIERELSVDFSASSIADAVEAAAVGHPFDPVLAYLRPLVWDQIPRIDRWLIAYAGAEESEYIKAVGAAFLVSAVARTFVPGCQVDTMLVLQGAQGRRKSSLLRELAGADNFTDSISDISSTDARMELHGPWIIEVAEMHRFSKKEMSAINAYLTSREDKYRPPYGRNIVAMPRRCVFAGTVNQEQFLRDETGGRRFWPAPVGEIDIDGVRRDRDQLWAEAVYRYRAGERWYLEGDREGDARGEQEKRRQRDPWEQIILEYVELRDHEIKTENYTTQELNDKDGMFDKQTMVRIYVTSEEILTHAVDVPTGQRTPFHVMRVGASLRAIGWSMSFAHIGGKRRRCYRPGADWLQKALESDDYDF